METNAFRAVGRCLECSRSHEGTGDHSVSTSRSHSGSTLLSLLTAFTVAVALCVLFVRKGNGCNIMSTGQFSHVCSVVGRGPDCHPAGAGARKNLGCAVPSLGTPRHEEAGNPLKFVPRTCSRVALRGCVRPPGRILTADERPRVSRVASRAAAGHPFTCRAPADSRLHPTRVPERCDRTAVKSMTPFMPLPSWKQRTGTFPARRS